MAFTKAIIQQIELQGAQVKREFDEISRHGVTAFTTLDKAAAPIDARLTSIEASAKRAGTSVGQFQRRMSGDGLGLFVRDSTLAADGLDDLGNKAVVAEAAIASTNTTAIKFGQTLRVLGRAAGIRELSLLSRQVNGLGRAFELAAPLILVAVLAKVVSSATGAVNKMQDLAFESKQSLADFQTLSSAEVAVGGGAEEAGKGFKGLSEMIKKSADDSREHEKTLRDLSSQLIDTRNKTRDLMKGFDDLARTQQEQDLSFRRSMRDIKQARADLTRTTPISDQEQQQRKLVQLEEQESDLLRKQAEDERKRVEEKRKLNKELADQRSKEREIKDAIAAAADAAARNATALDKLGVMATTTSGKLRQVPEVLNDIADRLQRLGESEERTKIEFDLVAAGLDRNLLPALRRGAEGYRQLQVEGSKIKTPFTPEQAKVADDFSIAMGRAASAMGDLRDKIGLAVAPTFTAFLEQFTKLIGDSREGILDFLGVFGGIFKDALNGIGLIINDIIIPVFKAMLANLDIIGAAITDLGFGRVTGMQLLAGAVILLGGAFARLPAAILAVTAVLGKFSDWARDNPVWIKIAIGALGGLALAFFTIPVAIGLVIAAIATVIQKWDDIVAAAKFVGEQMKLAWETFGNWFATTWLGQIVSTVTSAISELGKFISAAKEAANSGDPMGTNAANQGFPTFAGGGWVRGPGTTTSDSIPAWLSKDEHVTRAKAAKYYGRNVMNMINDMRFPKNFFRGFANGGNTMMGPMPAMPPLRMAKGGPVPRAMRTLNLNIDGFGSISGLLAPETVAQKLIQRGNVQRVRSGGRKPTSYGRS